VDAGKSPVRKRSLRSALLQLVRDLVGSRFNCSARSSASLVTVGWVEYQ
jgi:hypothetical protein